MDSLPYLPKQKGILECQLRMNVQNNVSPCFKQNSGNERRFEERMTLDCERQFAKLSD